MTATTALTAQNTKGVYGIHLVPPEFLRQQIDAVIEDVGVDVVKTGPDSLPNPLTHSPFPANYLLTLTNLNIGMLGSAEAIITIADALTYHKVSTVVIDPVRYLLPLPSQQYFLLTLPQVMIATTGAQLLPPSTLHLLQTHLLPLATIVTPNVPEALRLLESAEHGGGGAPPRDVRTADDLEAMARAIRALGPRWVLVKGGHCPFGRDGVVAEGEEGRERVVDVLVGEEGAEEVVVRMETGYCRTRHTHGTGCSLACEFFLFFLLALSLSLSLSLSVSLSRSLCLFLSFGCMRDGDGVDLAGSGDCVELGKGDGDAGCGEGGVSVCPGGHQDCAGAGWREWPVESLSLGLYPPVFAVWGPSCFLARPHVLADVSSSGHFIDYFLERPDVAPVWEKFVNHPFVLAMGDGTLPLESFKGYLIQDYIYLVSGLLWLRLARC